MTRWARSGNTQKHQKMPGDATPWSEFANQESNKCSTVKQKEMKNKNFKRSAKLDVVQNMELSSKRTDINKRKYKHESTEKPEVSSKKQKLLHVKDMKVNTENCHTSNSNTFHKIKIEKEDNIKNVKNDESSNIQRDAESKEKSAEQTVSLKKKNKNRYKKRKAKQCNIKSDTEKSAVTNDNTENPISMKVFENKKKRYMEKLKKRRAENGILLLPSKIERKLYIIKKRLREKGLPSPVIKGIIRKERRREELKFRKTFNSSKPCFNCRKPGHLLADCPEKLSSSNQGTGICFKCGSIEHTSFKCPMKIQGFPFAKCFICKEQGHISRECPTNKHGVYPKGGRCNLCGNVNHLKKDCPSLIKKEDDNSAFILHTINEASSIDEEIKEEENVMQKKNEKKPKIVKF